MLVKLSNQFYKREAIEEALKDFKEVCEGKVLNDGFEIELQPKASIENLSEEFCNYVLGLMKSETFV